MEVFKSHVVCIGKITRTTSDVIVHIDFGDLAGNHEVLSLGPEIGSKKGKISNREGNDSHQKVTKPRGRKVTETPKGERKPRRSMVNRIRQANYYFAAVSKG